MLGIVVNTGTAQTFTGLTGWTQVLNLNVNSPVLAVFTKRCTSGDIGATVVIGWTTTANAGAAILAYTGVDSVTPIDTTASSNAASGSTINYGTATAPLNDLIVSIGAITNSGSVSTGTPAGFTSRVDLQTAVVFGMHDKQVTAGSTGAVTSSSASASSTSQGVLLALRPAQVPAWRASALTSGIASTSFAVACAASTQIGDTILAMFEWASTPGTVTPPAGWTTLIPAAADGNGGNYFGVYSFVATAAGSTTFTFAWSTSVPSGGATMSSFAGVGSVDVVGAFSGNASSPVTFTGVTTTDTDELLVALAVHASNTSLVSPGMVNVTGPLGAYDYHQVLVEAAPVAVATGTRVLTGAAAFTGGVLVALKPPVKRVKVRGAARNVQAGGTSVSATLPPNQTAGDYAVVVVHWNNNPGTVTDPSGWTVIESDLAGTNNVWMKAYAKITGASEAAPTISWVNSIAALSHSACTIGAVTLDVDGHTTTGASNLANFPSVTTTGGRLVLFFASAPQTSGTTVYSPPTGATEVMDPGSSTFASEISYEMTAAAAATGARSAANNDSFTNNTLGYVVTLTPVTAKPRMLVG